MDLGERMKRYEKAYDTYMPWRLPVIVRLDGKGFSKLTKKFKMEKPFDSNFCEIMAETMRHVAKNIEGCVFGYTQSDEITLILKNDQSNDSTPWFGNRVQKIVSVTASMATSKFAMEFNRIYGIFSSANFDSRVFVVPNWQEAINNLAWRQNDSVKNSILASCYYELAKKIGKKTAQKEMYKLNQKQQQELLFSKAGINWNNYPTKFKRGIGCYRVVSEVEIDGNACLRSNWYLDEEIPIFAQDQNFLRKIFDSKDEA